MNITDRFKLKDTISFDTLAPSILGAKFTRVKVMAVLDSQSASQHIDVVAMHRNIFPMLPAGTPDQLDAAPYLKLQLPNGEVTVVSLNWIRLETVEVFVSTSANFAISNIASTDIERITALLKANGYNSIEVNVL